MEPQSKKNQVKLGKYGSIISQTFSSRSHNCQVLSMVTKGLLHSKIYPQNLSSQYLVVWGSKNSKEGGAIIQTSQKEKPFQSHKKLSAIWGNLTFHHHSLPLPRKTFLILSVWPSRKYTWALIWKNLSDLFQPPIPTGRVERG